MATDLGAALRWMWQAFARNLAAFLVPAIVYGVLMVVLGGGVVIGMIAYSIHLANSVPAQQSLSSGQVTLIITFFLVGALIMALGALLWQSGIARAAGIVRDGQRPSIGQAFIGGGRVLLTILVVAVLTALGSLLFILPGLVVAVLFFFAIPASVRGARLGAALSGSFRLATRHLATTIVAMVIVVVAGAFLGSIAIGTIVAVPLTVLLQMGLHERLSGRELPEPVRA